jgi:hypothetical protein
MYTYINMILFYWKNIDITVQSDWNILNVLEWNKQKKKEMLI